MDRGIQAFLAVAREGSTTLAASEINLTQSSVTKRIATLELELGAPLFKRDRRGMFLTEAGKLFFLRAERIEQEYKNGIEEIKLNTEAGMSRLVVGAGPVFHMNWISGLFDELIQQFPNLKLELKTNDHDSMGRRLRNAELDIYLGILLDEDIDDSVYSQRLIDVEHGIVVRSDNPVSKNEFIDPSLLNGYRWVSFTTDPVTEKRIKQYTLPKDSQASFIDIRTTSLASGIQLVQTGHFVMSAPLQLANNFEREGLIIKPVKERMELREAGIYVRKSTLESYVVQFVIKYMQEITNQLS
jgi:DNA-binding transcriptional LysR family regulator